MHTNRQKHHQGDQVREHTTRNHQKRQEKRMPVDSPNTTSESPLPSPPTNLRASFNDKAKSVPALLQQRNTDNQVSKKRIGPFMRGGSGRSRHGGMPGSQRAARCKICTKRPFISSQMAVAANIGFAELMEGDLGLYPECGATEYLPNGKEDKSSKQPVITSASKAKKVADYVNYKVQKIKSKINDGNGVPVELGINLEKNMKSMGLFDLDEIRVGELLGVGGFSTVYTINGFDIDNDSYNKTVTPSQVVAREFLRNHAIRSQNIVPPKNSTNESAENNNNNSRFKFRAISHNENEETKEAISKYRYALKHLSASVGKKVANKSKLVHAFAGAATDLATEAHLLLTMDHPHIIRIRGFAKDGPDGYKSGYHNGYFLILDLLPDSLENRIFEWRSHYKSICSMVPIWNQFRPKKKEAKVHQMNKKKNIFLTERLKVAHDVASAVEYLHSNRIIYRDLKSPNIGFDIRGDVKIFDFGLARVLPQSASSNETVGISIDTSQPASMMSTEAEIDDEANESQTFDENAATPQHQLKQKQQQNQQSKADNECFRISIVGTESYMAPEVRGRQSYGLKADVYSFGVLLWELLTLSTPRNTLKANKDHNKDRNNNDAAAATTNGNDNTRKSAFAATRAQSKKIFEKGKEPKYYENNLPMCPCWPLEIQALMKRILSSNHRDRPTMKEIQDSIRTIVQSIKDKIEDDDNEQNNVKIDLTPKRRSTYVLEISDNLLAQFDDDSEGELSDDDENNMGGQCNDHENRNDANNTAKIQQCNTEEESSSAEKDPNVVAKNNAKKRFGRRTTM